jgi:beta-barrel assembly-enhancing protease
MIRQAVTTLAVLSMSVPSLAQVAAPAAPSTAPGDDIAAADDDPGIAVATAIPARVAQLRAQEERLVRISQRLALAAAPWCEPHRSMGWLLGDLGQYPKTIRQVVRDEWNLPSATTLFISAIAPDSAAARAGLTPGLAITSINGEAPMRYVGNEASRHALANSERVVEEALTANAGVLTFETLALDGTRRSWTVTGRATCPTRFEMSADSEKQAFADGDIVQVTMGMALYATADNELAGVIAHELGHNMLRHRLRSDARGIPVNYTRHLTRNARQVRGMEEEADRMSVWLLAQAGIDPTAPIAFWQRFGPNNDSPHPFGRLHDPWELRVAHLEDELALMRAARPRVPSTVRPPLLVQALAEEAAAAAATAAGEETRTDTPE